MNSGKKGHSRNISYYYYHLYTTPLDDLFSTVVCSYLERERETETDRHRQRKTEFYNTFKQKMNKIIHSGVLQSKSNKHVFTTYESQS